MRALILFMHIVGALILFAGFGLESVGLRQLRRSGTVNHAQPWLALFSLVLRLYPAALAVLLLTGGYLASNVGVWQFGWVRISMATLVITTVVGIITGLRVRALYRNSLKAHTGALDGRLRASWLAALLGARGAAALGIVYGVRSLTQGRCHTTLSTWIANASELWVEPFRRLHARVHTVCIDTASPTII